MRSSTGLNTTTSATATAGQHSPWHSPVPYLFGGLAAMLGLIAFALLILACSYWKLSGYLEGEGERDLESGDGGEEDPQKARADAGFKAGGNLEARVVVIMAGQEKPTFLATPMSSRASSFGDGGAKSQEEKEGVVEGAKVESEPDEKRERQL
ncbi:Protein GLUTAMINE DUMPER 3 [Acorus gramineus]|uniref:Protein GLUTAMINE DUMPER 3 n=1 Tax=Acorus gramineus TaxID=55184 RepID=A0AAV9AYG7_ACOGR|nr:Protein GLUTAMINE DUMPER 3 [Acorus gramineus]